MARVARAVMPHIPRMRAIAFSTTTSSLASRLLHRRWLTSGASGIPTPGRLSNVTTKGSHSRSTDLTGSADQAGHVAENKLATDSDDVPVARKSKYYTVSEDSAIIEGIAQGRSRAAIADFLGRSLPSVTARIVNVLQYKPEGSQLNRQLGLREPSQLTIPGLSATQINAFILKRVQEGYTFAHIAGELGTTRTRVRRQYHLLCHPSKRATAGKALRLTCQDKQSLREHLAAGTKTAQIATELGRSYQDLKNRIRWDPSLHDLLPVRPQKQFTLAEANSILRHRAQGLTYPAIAALLGRPTLTVWRKHKSWTAKIQRDSMMSRRRWTSADDDTVLRLHDSGHSIKSMAKEMNREACTISLHLPRALQRAGRSSADELYPVKAGR